jgi:hypothetical protein
MKVFILYSFLFAFCFTARSQAKIIFDTTKYDLGYITESSASLKKEIYFTNTGTEPLIIERASTGDGGSYATWEKEPIAPGKSGKIIFIYDRKRIGPFNRGIYISSNAVNGNQSLNVKGTVVYKKTEIEVSKKDIHVGSIAFDSIAEFEFYVYNRGNAPLHFLFDSYRNYDIDLLSLKINESTTKNTSWYMGSVCEPGDSLKVEGKFINLFGNTGNFNRELIFIYNSNDTLKMNIKGSYFCAKPIHDKLSKNLYSKEYQSFHYSKNKLEKIQKYNFEGTLYREAFFEDSYCTKIIQYKQVQNTSSIENEKIFEKGKLVKEIKN